MGWKPILVGAMKYLGFPKMYTRRNYRVVLKKFRNLIQYRFNGAALLKTIF